MSEVGAHDKMIARIFLILSALFILFVLTRWFHNTSFDGSMSLPGLWHESVLFVKRDFSIALAIYLILVMQVAGWMELRHGASFLISFGLNFVLTPIVYIPIFLIRHFQQRKVNDA